MIQAVPLPAMTVDLACESTCQIGLMWTWAQTVLLHCGRFLHMALMCGRLQHLKTILLPVQIFTNHFFFFNMASGHNDQKFKSVELIVISFVHWSPVKCDWVGPNSFFLYYVARYWGPFTPEHACSGYSGFAANYFFLFFFLMGCNAGMKAILFQSACKCAEFVTWIWSVIHWHPHTLTRAFTCGVGKAFRTHLSCTTFCCESPLNVFLLQLSGLNHHHFSYWVAVS